MQVQRAQSPDRGARREPEICGPTCATIIAANSNAPPAPASQVSRSPSSCAPAMAANTISSHIAGMIQSCARAVPINAGLARASMIASRASTSVATIELSATNSRGPMWSIAIFWKKNAKPQISAISRMRMSAWMRRRRQV